MFIFWPILDPKNPKKWKNPFYFFFGPEMGQNGPKNENFKNSYTMFLDLPPRMLHAKFELPKCIFPKEDRFFRWKFRRRRYEGDVGCASLHPTFLKCFRVLTPNQDKKILCTDTYLHFGNFMPFYPLECKIWPLTPVTDTLVNDKRSYGP